MNDLERYRIKIDSIDEQLMQLFEERMHVAKAVVAYKIENNLAIYQPEREQQVIEKNVGRIVDPNIKPYAKELLVTLMDVSKSYQSDYLRPIHEIDNVKATPFNLKEIRVGYQGVEGSFSQEAMIQYFSEEVTSFHYSSFEDVFERLIVNAIDYGVLPIENSSTGAVNDVFDLINRYGVYIVGEVSLPVKQHLLGIKGATIDQLEQVFSHPQGLYQSSEFLKKYPTIKQQSYDNTAMAAQYVKQLGDKRKAAIASLRAAKIYDLEVLKENIQNTETNHTRFIIISKQLENKQENHHLSILFTLQHRSGTLFNILKIIANYGLNMVSIQSRPVVKTAWEYYFYVDFTGNLEDENVLKAIDTIKQHCNSFRLLGVY